WGKGAEANSLRIACPSSVQNHAPLGCELGPANESCCRTKMAPIASLNRFITCNVTRNTISDCNFRAAGDLQLNRDTFFSQPADAGSLFARSRRGKHNQTGWRIKHV